ncbi:MAG: metal-dependent transcriptional regulator [Anaerolineae bacterium]|nr:metal-dependent transcriptional regulator [Anaerolineae bacterium]
MSEPARALLFAAVLMALASGLLWPQHGLISRWRQARRATTRVLTEDALKHLHWCAVNQQQPTIHSLAGVLQISENRTADLLTAMQNRNLLEVRPDGLQLTTAGMEYALHMVRAHRLWERYLADETGYQPLAWHELADQMEHRLTPAAANALAATLGNPTYDPHGDPIPSAEGDVLVNGSQPLTAMQPQQAVRIVHLEDEPAVVYAQLVAEGFYPGMEAQLLEMTPQRVRLWADGNEHILAPIVAANINVRPLEVALTAAVEPTLADLKPGEQGRVVRISARCRGAERRRFLDLGILPGTLIGAEMRSLSGDPTAYRIREALIALRREQAALIAISPAAEATL